MAPCRASCTADSRIRDQRSPDSNGARVRLTGNRRRHIKKRTVPSDDEEDLADGPILSPDMLDFAIEEDQPIVYLIIGNRPRNG